MLVVNHFLYFEDPAYFGGICLVFRYFGSSKDGAFAQMGHGSHPGKNLKVLHAPRSITKMRERNG